MTVMQPASDGRTCAGFVGVVLISGANLLAVSVSNEWLPRLSGATVRFAAAGAPATLPGQPHPLYTMPSIVPTCVLIIRRFALVRVSLYASSSRTHPLGPRGNPLRNGAHSAW
jgi:hypothetical protein